MAQERALASDVSEAQRARGSTVCWRSPRRVGRLIVVFALLVALGAAGGDAVAGKRRHRGSNMPEGWQWPPSPTR